MQLRRSEQAQRVERSKEDSQGNFQIKAGHARVLELGVSHKQLSHCGKSNELNSDSSHIKSCLFFLGRTGFEVSVRCDGFYERGDMAHWGHTHRHYALTYVSLPLHAHMHKHFTLILKTTLNLQDTHLQPDRWISLI